jgi:hypothetical protein
VAALLFVSKYSAFRVQIISSFMARKKSQRGSIFVLFVLGYISIELSRCATACQG